MESTRWLREAHPICEAGSSSGCSTSIIAPSGSGGGVNGGNVFCPLGTPRGVDIPVTGDGKLVHSNLDLLIHFPADRGIQIKPVFHNIGGDRVMEDVLGRVYLSLER